MTELRAFFSHKNKVPIYIETEAFRKNPPSHPRAAIIWLHGLGADGHDFVPLAHDFEKKTGLALRFIFPHAPSRPVTINQGAIMPAWYDITGFGLEAREDKAGLEETTAFIFKLMDEQKKAGILTQNIFLGGFSQGGAAILYAGLQYPEPLGGLIALSAYLPFSHALPSFIKTKKDYLKVISIFWSFN